MFMNSKKTILLLLYLFGILGQLPAAKIDTIAFNYSLASPAKKAFSIRYSPEEMQAQLSEVASQIDLQVNAAVEDRIRALLTKNRSSMEYFLGRSTIYFPLFEQKLKQSALPEALKYLPIIESGLRPKVKSRRGAAGLWQLMPATARAYGLTINDWVDERLDPNKATIVALRLLSDLYREFGDWTLAMAAYNCGPKRVRKAMEKRRSKDFWKIRRFLPRETREYVEKFAAMAYLMNYYSFFNLRPRYPDYNLQLTFSVQLYSRKSFDQISLESGVPIALVRQLNPSYLKAVIPADGEGNYLILPRLGTPWGYGVEGMQQLKP